MPRYTNPILLKLKAAGLLPKGRRPNRKATRWFGQALADCRAMFEDDTRTIVETARHFKTSRADLKRLAKKHGWVRVADGRSLNMRRLNARPEHAEWEMRRLAAVQAYWVVHRLPEHLRHRPWKYREMLAELGRETTVEALS